MLCAFIINRIDCAFSKARLHGVNRTVTLLLSVDSFVHIRSRMSFIILEKWSFISLSCWHVDK